MNKGTYRLLALGILPIVALLVIIGAAGAAPKGGVTVDLKVAQSEFRASQDVLVTVTLSNRTKQPAHILKWLTPADGVDASLFTVTQGRPAGRLHRSPGQAARRHRQRLPRARARRERQQRGRPRRRLRLHGDGPLRDLLQRLVLRSLRQEGHAGEGQGRARVRHDQRQGGRARGQGQAAAASAARPRPERLQCMHDRAAVSAQRRPDAGEGVRGERGELPRRRTIRGPATRRGSASSRPTRYTTVTSHFNAISSAMQNAGITFDCSSKRNVYAYVYPNRAVQDLPGSRLLDGAGGRHRLPGRHADPRDEPLRPTLRAPMTSSTARPVRSRSRSAIRMQRSRTPTATSTSPRTTRRTAVLTAD